MKPTMYAAIAAMVLSLALLFSGCVRLQNEKPALEVGKPAPAFKLPDLDGKEVSLDQYKGQVVMLDFWATWCNPCRISMPILEQLQKEYPKNMVLLAINLQESRDEVRSFIREQGLNPSHVLLDQKGELGQMYGTDSIPMQVLIDKEGIVRDVRAGYNPSMVNMFRAQIERLK